MDVKDLPCIKNFITFATVCQGETLIRPLSGLNIEQLPGLYRKSLAQINPGKYLNAQAFLDEKVITAGDMVITRMRNYLEEFVVERGTREAGTVGTFNDTALGASASPRGVRVKLNPSAGALMLPLIPRVWIKSNTTKAGVTVKVKDGARIVEYPVDLVAGEEVELWLHFEAQTKQVDITIEDDDVDVYGGSTTGTTYFADCNTCSRVGLYKEISGSGLLASAETDELQGIKAEVITVCSIMQAACMLLGRYKWAVLYQVGILICDEWDASDRANYFTLHSKEWARAQSEKWNMIDLPRHMKTSNNQLLALVRNLDPKCLECGTGPTMSAGHG